MLIVKNSFGISTVAKPGLVNYDTLNTFGGSALNRLEKENTVEFLLQKPLEMEGEVKQKREKKPFRTMSQRTKSKIRKKIIALSQVCPKLTFLTLTFVNQVEDKQAVKILKAFLDNATKRFKDFQYLWVAERQTNNAVFKDNIHFHIVNNRFWKIEKWLPYWVGLQEQRGVERRNKDSLPSSSFNIKSIRSNNIKGLTSYLTKYVTKNESKFQCQVWNCSQKISRLYTDHYTDGSFLTNLYRLEKHNLLGGEIKVIQHDFANVHVYPLNQKNMRLYDTIKEKNTKIWNTKS